MQNRHIGICWKRWSVVSSWKCFDRVYRIRKFSVPHYPVPFLGAYIELSWYHLFCFSPTCNESINIGTSLRWRSRWNNTCCAVLIFELHVSNNYFIRRIFYYTISRDFVQDFLIFRSQSNAKSPLCTFEVRLFKLQKHRTFGCSWLLLDTNTNLQEWM